jgi:hypothetical protein
MNKLPMIFEARVAKFNGVPTTMFMDKNRYEKNSFFFGCGQQYYLFFEN